MRQWVRNAAPSWAAGVRGSLGCSTCPCPDGHPRGSGSRNSGRQEMNGDPRGGGAKGPGAPRGLGFGKAPTPHQGPESEAWPGRPLPGGAERTRQGPGQGPSRAPPGFSPPRCHVPPALRLRDGPAPSLGSTGPGHIGLARGRPARDRTGGRASRPRADPPPGLGIPETVQPPPEPDSLLLLPRPSRWRPCDVIHATPAATSCFPSAGAEWLLVPNGLRRAGPVAFHFPKLCFSVL